LTCTTFYRNHKYSLRSARLEPYKLPVSCEMGHSLLAGAGLLFGEVRDLTLVSNDPAQRRMGKCNVLPWKMFLEKLWACCLLFIYKRMIVFYYYY
jgi:hypothetical protein